MDSESQPSWFTKLKERLGGDQANTPQELEREIQGLVDQGEAKGLISPGEADMIEAVLTLSDTTAGQIMAPRTDLALVPDSAEVSEVISVIVDSGHSRIPIYTDDADHIVGVIYAKDLLPHWGEPNGGVRLKDMMRQAYFVPQAMTINEVMTFFKRHRVHLAVVVDEYGGTAGVVTMEDVLEEIVGEIEDEYDPEEQKVQEQDDGSLLVDARLEVDELADRLEVDLPCELAGGRFETVGGFITTLLGRVPHAQEEVAYGPVRMKVTGADQRRVTQVLVHLADDPVSAEA